MTLEPFKVRPTLEDSGAVNEKKKVLFDAVAPADVLLMQLYVLQLTDSAKCEIEGFKFWH